MDEQTLYSATTEIQKGITLVEASAGTGKTFALSMHVLRGVVEQEIRIDQILVVTFTVAATDELRERTRARLVEGRNILLGKHAEYDAVLKEWDGRIRDKERAVRLLDLALLDIDRIGVYTIHGFCQRMLMEQPLESGQPFDLELISDARLIKKDLVHDYWRKQFYQFDPRFCSLVTARYPDPDSLYQSVAGAEDLLAELLPPQGSISDICARIDLYFFSLKEWWDSLGTNLLVNLDEAAVGGYLNQRLKTHYREWYEDLDNSVLLAQPPAADAVHWLTDDQILEQLNGRKLRGVEKKESYISGWNLPGEVISSYLESVDQLILAIRVGLAETLRANFSETLSRRRKITFDDLVTRFAAAVSGRGGEVLRRQIGQRYKMVLIDEFQDTDSAQYRIFNNLFGSGKHFLYLIGDPKQAIYRFRGADIFSYFQARKNAQRVLSLHQNFRSHPGLVTALNELLSGTSFSGIKYRAIQPARKADDARLIGMNKVLSPLICCQLDKQSEEKERWSGSSAQEQVRRWIVAEIARLIGGSDNVVIEKSDLDGSVGQEPLRPGDIAILVRTNRQAQEYQDNLSNWLIPSVVASKTSVFKTVESEQLLLVLNGVINPGNINALKTAISSDWFGLAGEFFISSVSDESMITPWVERFQFYHQVWVTHGFLTMITRLLVRESVFIHLSGMARGERRIANIQHLCELVQEEAQLQGFTMEQARSWLQKMMSSDIAMDEVELRLESDADAVAIVTMHGAKGLEFPVTFCPFLMSGSGSGNRVQTITRSYDRDDKLIVDLGSEYFEEHLARAREEDTQEEFRLAYVAMTRAQLRCYLFWADIKGWSRNPDSFQSALGQILFPGGNLAFSSQYDHLQSICNTPEREHILIPEMGDDSVEYVAADAEQMKLQARERKDQFFETCRSLTSFSGLASSSSFHTEPLAGAFDEKIVDHRLRAVSRLPKGVRFGNIVHDTLELLNFSDIRTGTYDRDQVQKNCRRYALEVDQEVLDQLLKNIVTTTLMEWGMQLAEIGEDCQVKEMEFSLFMTHSTTAEINRILENEDTYVPLLYREMEGFLNGFVDLICEHGGKYYIIDYKTNYLGESVDDYSRDALQSAMRVHNYGLQYWLYSLVVHRFLQKWHAGYSYHEHFGGVMYLFVRGMVPTLTASGVYHTIPDYQKLSDLDRCFGGTKV